MSHLFGPGNKAAVGHGGRSHKYKEQIASVFEDYNPLQRLKDLSLTTDDQKIRALCDKELAQYYAPKLKAVEISVDKDSPLQFNVNIKGAASDAGVDNVQCDKNS